MTLLALPTRRDEAWKYSDLNALAEAWPLNPPEVIRVAAGEEIARIVVQDAPAGSVAVKDIAIVLEKGARATFLAAFWPRWSPGYCVLRPTPPAPPTIPTPTPPRARRSRC